MIYAKKFPIFNLYGLNKSCPASIETILPNEVRVRDFLLDINTYG